MIPNENYSFKHCPGEFFSAFVKETEDLYFLGNINVYADANIQISGTEAPLLLSLDELREQVNLNNIVL